VGLGRGAEYETPIAQIALEVAQALPTSREHAEVVARRGTAEPVASLNKRMK
jgi:hypothetical protein